MNINRKEYENHLEYFRQINAANLEDIVFDGTPMNEVHNFEELKFTGLSNKCLIEIIHFD